jgi:hypothetical protein
LTSRDTVPRQTIEGHVLQPLLKQAKVAGALTRQHSEHIAVGLLASGVPNGRWGGSRSPARRQFALPGFTFAVSLYASRDIFQTPEKSCRPFFGGSTRVS